MTIKKTVDDYLNSVRYDPNEQYIPSDNTLKFVNFIKLVNGGSEENTTPLFHLKILDSIFNTKRRHAMMNFRGSAKTSLLMEYLILFIAAFGYLPGYGTVDAILFLGDSVENGVKNLRRNIEFRYNNSAFLQDMIPNKKITLGGDGRFNVPATDENEAGRKFTDVRLEFKNKKGHMTVVRGFGAKSGLRGGKELGKRYQLALLDDLLGDADADSDLVLKSITNIVYKAVSKALHPTKQKTIWCGTPFNKKDPLYMAVESGVWNASVYPVCEKFPCTKDEFRGAWEDRFPYDYVKDEYDTAVATGTFNAFNQELMLRILSDEDRLITTQDLMYYDLNEVIKHKHQYNFYITTDFATSEKEKSDYSVISVWCIDHNGNYRYVDGIIKRQLMDQNINALFNYVKLYEPMEVGIEVTGQQGGFIQWIEREMNLRRIYFNLASEPGSNKVGIKPTTSKLQRFNTVLPLFKQKKIWFPESYKNTPLLDEILDELLSVTITGIKSKHDDFIDTVSMLSKLRIIVPEKNLDFTDKNNLYNKYEDLLEVNTYEVI